MPKNDNTSLYIKDMQLYEATLADIRWLWYQEHSETLSKSDVVLKSLLFMKQNLLEQKMAGSFESKLKISDKYGRVG